VQVEPADDSTDQGLASVLLFPQVSPTPETAGVQTASISSDRTAITIQIMPLVQRILPTIGAMIPSTGGPSAALFGSALLAVGGLGLWLRRAGRERGRRP
jgi:hypothetical protein